MTALIQVLMKVIALAGKIGLVLRAGKIIWNLPKLYRFVKKYRGVAESLIREHRLPKGPEAQEFLRATAELVRADIIDVPNFDEAEFAEKLELLAAELEEAA